MILMDAINRASDMVKSKRLHTGQGGDPILAIFPDLVERMRLAPRYLFDASATEAIVEISMGRPKVLREAMRNLRIPYPSMWIEWEEIHRDRIRAFLPSEAYSTPLRPLPARLGFLIECGEGGRSGCVTWVWSGPQLAGFEMPNVGPISAFFDLDSIIEQDETRTQGLLNANLVKQWSHNPLQLEHLLDIWRTAEHIPSSWGLAYFQHAGHRFLPGHPSLSPADMIAHAYADVYGEYIGVWAALMLLTSSRQAVDYQTVSRAKLNKQRVKRREIPLLDHTQVTMHVEERVGFPRQGSPLGYTRKSPRIHIVSRYLARRGNHHWIVEPYLRGSGDDVHRNVKVAK